MLYLMNLACANWANKYKIQVANNIIKFLNRTATLTSIGPDGKPMPERQAQEIKDFRDNLKALANYRINDLKNLNMNANNKAMFYKKLILQILNTNPINKRNSIPNNVTYH